MLLENLAGLALFGLALTGMYMIVPKRKIRELFLTGLVGGLGVALVLVFVMQNIYGFWIFTRVDLFYLMKIPLFLSAAWIPIVISFCYYLSHADSFLDIIAPILLIPLGAIIVHYILIQNNMLMYHEWTLFRTFIISFVIHLGIAAYVYFNNKLKTDE